MWVSKRQRICHLHDNHYHRPLELGRLPKTVSDPPTLLILSCPPDLGRKFSLKRSGSYPTRSSLGTKPGRRWGGTNLSGFGDTNSLSLSLFRTWDGELRDEPVRPKGRSEIESDSGSDRGRSDTGWIGFGFVGCVMGLGVGRVKTRIRPCLFGAETAE